MEAFTALVKEYRGEVDRERLEKAIFEPGTVHAMIMISGEPVGFCLWYDTFSTETCRKGIYLDSLYVREELRGEGLGEIMFENIARIAEMGGYERLEWKKDPEKKFFAGHAADAPTVLRVEGIENITKLWGHCHCHE